MTGRGRPKKTRDAKRDNLVAVRFSTAEHVQATKIAAAVGVSLSAWVRMQALAALGVKL